MRKKIYEYKLTRIKNNVCMEELAPYNNILCADHVVYIMRKLVGEAAREHMYAFYLDTHNLIIGYELLGVGGANQVHISVPDMLRSALVCGAVGVIVSHNHPSGKSDPSESDNNLTQEVKKGLSIIGLQLYDHVVVAAESFYSYAQKDKL